MTDSLVCSVLASGSTGNAVYVQAGTTRLLIDSGVSLRQLQVALDQIKVDGNRLDAVLVTHEHSDHVKGLKAVIRKWELPVYTSDGTWSSISSMWKDEDAVTARIIRANSVFTLGQIAIEPFALSHDALEPLGFCFHFQGKKLVLATDLGYVSDRIKQVAQGAHAFILETNHDVDMLRTGPYPWHLKRRILGDKGHLSNETAAEFLVDCLSEQTHSVFLAHLSKENNRETLAHDALSLRLKDYDHDLAEQITLRMTNPLAATPLLAV